MQIIKEEKIDLKSPNEIEKIIGSGEIQNMSALLTDLLECVRSGHITEVSRFTGMSDFIFEKKLEVKLKRLTHDEDIEMCKNWRKFATKSLKLTE